MKDFRELKVGPKAHRLTLAVDQLTSTFPRQELYGWTSQIRRSCSSIPANRPASWSNLLLARDLKLIQPNDYTELAQRTTELKRMLTALFQKLNADR